MNHCYINNACLANIRLLVIKDSHHIQQRKPLDIELIIWDLSEFSSVNKALWGFHYPVVLVKTCNFLSKTCLFYILTTYPLLSINTHYEHKTAILSWESIYTLRKMFYILKQGSMHNELLIHLSYISFNFSFKYLQETQYNYPVQAQVSKIQGFWLVQNFTYVSVNII